MLGTIMAPSPRVHFHEDEAGLRASFDLVLTAPEWALAESGAVWRASGSPSGEAPTSSSWAQRVGVAGDPSAGLVCH